MTLGLGACSSWKTSGPPQTAVLITGGRVFGHPGADAVLITGNRIAAVGKAVDLRAQAQTFASHVDAAGAHILPGLHDAHTHLMDGGLASFELEISAQDKINDIVKKVSRYAAKHPEQDRILGRGWSYDIVPQGSFPSRRDLDQAAADKPVILESYDGHALWVNSRALELAKITPQTADPEGGKIAREANGVAQGVLLESAMELMQKALPPPDQKIRMAALDSALQQYLELGVTSVTDLSPLEDDSELKLFEELQKQGRLPLRVTACTVLGGNLNLYEKIRKQYQGPFLRLGPLKGFVDGVIESKTAYMLKPYQSGSERGGPRIPPDRLKELVAAAHARGFTVALHSIGDAAVRLALDAFAEAAKRHPGIQVRHRVEHAEVVDPNDLRRFKALGTAASLQPLHSGPDSGVWAKNLGAKRVSLSFPFKALLAKDAILAFGSDWPVASNNPYLGIAAAASSIPVEEAVKAYTHGPAYAIGRENELGKIEPGYLADIVVLWPEIHLEKRSTLGKARARAVIVDGRLSLRPN